MDQLALMLNALLLLSSLAVWGMIIERLSTGQSLVERSVPATRPRPWFASLLAASLVLLSCYSQFHVSRSDLTSQVINEDQLLAFIASQIGEKFLLFCLMLLCLTKLGGQRLTRFGIDARHWNEEFGIGLLGWLAATIPVLIANLSMLAFRGDDNQHVFLQILHSDRSWPMAGLMVTSAVVMAPLGEELLYRVILQGTLQQFLSPTASILISASLFSAVHGFPDAVGLFPLALILGFLYWRTGSYLTIITTHAAFNAVTVILILMSPKG